MRRSGWCYCLDLALIMTTLPQQQHTVTTWGVNKRKEKEEERGRSSEDRELPGSRLENSHDFSVRQDSIIINIREHCQDSGASI